MRVLIVARYKERGYAPFVAEQVVALEQTGVECQYFPMRNKGIKGYLQELPELREAIRQFNPDIIHAHYGLCGLLANLQRRVPVVTTYHGSDINNPSVLWFSRIAMRLSAYNIFVSQKNIDQAKPRKKYALIPCGITLDDYPIIEKDAARVHMGFSQDKKYILFGGAFDNAVKNAPFAKAVVALLPEAELIELKGFSRDQMAVLMQAVDVLLMTSFSEGSPQVIKEALATGCPIVSVNVGDVQERVKNVEGCWIVERDIEETVKSILLAFAFGKRTDGRAAIVRDRLTNSEIASQIKDIYFKALEH